MRPSCTWPKQRALVWVCMCPRLSRLVQHPVSPRLTPTPQEQKSPLHISHVAKFVDVVLFETPFVPYALYPALIIHSTALLASDDIGLFTEHIKEWMAKISSTPHVAPEPARDQQAPHRMLLRQYLNKRLRITLSDGRVVEGSFACTGTHTLARTPLHAHHVCTY